MSTIISQLQSLFDLDTLFDARPPSAFAPASLFVTVFVVLIALWAVTPFALRTFLPQKEYAILRQFIRKVTSYLAVPAFFGIFLIWCRVQYVAIFSMRIWLLALVLMMVGMIGYFVFEASVEYPKFMSMFKRELEKEKYLPKRKTRK